MEELPLVRLAHREEICLTLEKGPEGMGAVGSFIVLLSAREVATSEQLRQTSVYKFMPATSILQKKTNDPSKEGKSFPGCFQSNISDLQCYRRNFSPRGFFKLLVYNKLPELFFFLAKVYFYCKTKQTKSSTSSSTRITHTNPAFYRPLLFCLFGLVCFF